MADGHTAGGGWPAANEQWPGARPMAFSFPQRNCGLSHNFLLCKIKNGSRRCTLQSKIGATRGPSTFRRWPFNCRRLAVGCWGLLATATDADAESLCLPLPAGNHRGTEVCIPVVEDASPIVGSKPRTPAALSSHAGSCLRSNPPFYRCTNAPQPPTRGLGRMFWSQ